MKTRSLSADELNEFMTSGELPAWTIEYAKEHKATQDACDHDGWNFKEHGRGCFKCGAIILDFGD